MSRNRLTPSVRERTSLSVRRQMPKTRSNPSVDRLRSLRTPKKLRGRSWLRISRTVLSKRGINTPRRCLLQLVDFKHSKLRKSKRRSFMRRLSRSLRQSMRMISDSRKRHTEKRWSTSKLRLMSRRRTTKSLSRETSLQSSKSLKIEKPKSSRLRIRIQRT